MEWRRSGMRLVVGLAVFTSLYLVEPAAQKPHAKPHRPDVVRGGRSPFQSALGAPLRTTIVPAARSGGQVAPDAAAGAVSTLVLYDTTGDYGWLGELYAILTANLASHFGTWTAQPITRYTAHQLDSFTATVYIGSTYDEPIPTAFLDDVLATNRPVTWIGFNIWQLTNRFQALNPTASFASQYGWMWSALTSEVIGTVTYNGTALRRYRENGAPLMTFSEYAPTVPVAFAVRDDGTAFPWAVRSRQLTFIGEHPFVYMVAGDRSLAFEDMLFDALAPLTPERHRALVRLEDIAPNADPAELRAIADYLYSQGVPFAFGVIPNYSDPTGYYNGGVRETVRLRDPEARP